MKLKLFPLPLSLCALVLSLSLPAARAAVLTITNNDTAGSLSAGTAWVGGVAPGAGNEAVFDATITSANPAFATNALGANATWGEIQLLNPAVPVTISAGSTLTLQGLANGSSTVGIDMSGAANSLTLSNAVALGSNQAWWVTNGQTLNVAGVISGAFPLTLNNGGSTNGTIIISPSANTYTGGTLINGGTVQFTSTSSTLGASGGTITNNGGTIIFADNGTAATTLSENLICSNTTVLNFTGGSGANNNAFNYSLGGSGTIYITNFTSVGETLTLGGNSSANLVTFAGNIIFVSMNANGLASQGSLRFSSGSTVVPGDAAASFNLGTNAADGVVLCSRPGGTMYLGELIGGPGTVLLGSRSTASTTTWTIGGLNTSTTFSGSISNFGSTTYLSALTKVGTGTLTLTGNNNNGGSGGLTGATTVSAGTLQIGDGNADGSLTGGAVTIASGATLAFNRPDTYTIANNIANSGSLNVLGGGTLNYTGSAYSGSGVINVLNGYFSLNSQVSTFGPVYVGMGATFDASQDGIFQSIQSLAGSGTVNSPAAVAVLSSISPGGSGTSGTLTINGGLTETGNVNNVFQLSSPGSTNDMVVVNGNFSVSGVNILYLSSFTGAPVANGVYPLITYTGTFTGTTNNFAVSALGFNAFVTNIVSANEIAVIITQYPRPEMNLTWVGDGSANNWDLTTSNWVNGATKFAFQSGDTVTFNDSGDPNTTVTLQVPVTPTLVVVSNSTAAAYTLTGSASIVGPTSLIKTNNGTLFIQNNNDYTGPTVIGGGTISIPSIALGGQASPIGESGNNATNLVFAGGTLAYTGASAATDRSALLNSPGGTFDVTSGQTLTLNGTLTGPGVLSLVDSGTLSPTAVNTYSGGTMVNNGTFMMNNVNSAGTGTINLNGGTLALTSSLTITNALNVLTASTLNINNTAQVLPQWNGPVTGFGSLYVYLLGNTTSTLSFGGASNELSGYTNTITFDPTSQGYVRFITPVNGGPGVGLNLGGGSSTMIMFDRTGDNDYLGSLSGGSSTSLQGAHTTPGIATTYNIGGNNASTTFSGVIADGTVAYPQGMVNIVKVGTGTLTLQGQNTYSGSTVVSNGVLALTYNSTMGSDASMADTTNIFINTGATLNLTGLNNPTLSLQPMTLPNGATAAPTLGGGGTLNLTANGSLYLNGNTVTPGVGGGIGTLTVIGAVSESTVNNYFVLATNGVGSVLQVNGTLNTSGGNTIQIISAGTTIADGTYPLINFTGAWNSSSGLSDFSLVLLGTYTNLFSLTSTANSIELVVGPPARPTANVVWVGDGSANNWDITSPNWSLNGVPASLFESGDTVLFTDTGSDNPAIALNSSVYPAMVVVSNSAEAYSFTGSGGIAGSATLIKTNSGTLTLLSSNLYNGPTIVSGGVLEIETGPWAGIFGPIGAASASPANLVVSNAATFRYSGQNAQDGMNRGLTVGAGGMNFAVTNASTSFTNFGLIAGSGPLTVSGKGMLVFAGGTTNLYTGGTVISNGFLALGNDLANWDTVGGSSVGPTNSPVTFLGTTGTLQLFGYGQAAISNYNTFYNPLVVPTNQVGTLQMYPRGTVNTGAGSGLDSTLTGSGTFNFEANYVRDSVSGNWSAFTGTINVSGTGLLNANVNTVGAVQANIDEFRLNSTLGYSNATIYVVGDPLGANNNPASTLVMCQTIASGATVNIGGLGGSVNAIIGTGTGSSGNTIWSVGWNNTTNTFAGTINNDQQTGVGVTSITKVGTGIWYLSGQNNYSGSTIVSNGVLALIPNNGQDGSVYYSTNFYIGAAGTFDVSALNNKPWSLNSGQFIGGGGTIKGAISVGSGNYLNPGGSTTSGTLTINGNLSEGGDTETHYLSTPSGTNNLPAGTNDFIQVLGNLNTSGGITLQVGLFGGGAPAAGLYPLITYTGTWNSSNGTNDFTVVPLGPFPNGFLVTNVTSATTNEIALLVIAPPRATNNIIWVGDSVNNLWDTITPNWSVGGVSSKFEFGDTVNFTDTGSANPAVNLDVSLLPGAVIVNNSAKTYTFGGSGGLTGPTGLVKTNNGTLFIQNNNTYTGPTVLGGGILSIFSQALSGMASPIGAAGNSPTNVVFAGGTLQFAGSGTIDHGMTVLTNGGSFDVTGGNSLTLSGVIVTATNGGPYAPFVLTDSGTLVLSGANTFTNNIVINAGVLSDLNVQNVNYPVVGGLGNPMIPGRTVTINNGGTLSLDVSGGNEFGGGSVTNLLGYVINAGGLMRITSGNATIGPVMLNGGILDGASGANSGAQYGAFAFTGNITVGAAATSTIESDIAAPDCLTAGTLAPFIIFNVTNASGILNVTTALANSSGTQAAAGLVKAGPGTMNLSAVNLYSGTTTISNGTLLVTSGGSISNGPVVITGGTLGGAGTVNGAITDQTGGNLAPGAQVSSPGTTLTCNSNVTLQLGSTTTMQVEHGYSPDQLTVAGTLTYGGILMVATNAGDGQAYQVGDTFTLFNLNGGTYNSASSFATIQPPPGPGLGWSGASLTANGQIQVVTASPVVAGFTRTPSSGVFPLAVTFNNTSSGATYWVWNFGDGTTLLTTSAASPRHTYTTAGNFTVIQTAYGPGGVSSVTNTASVIVAYPPPVAMFLTTPTNGFLPLLVTNTDASTGVITNWLWTLGDGTTVTNSSNTNVVHSYAAAGTYTVSLTVTGPGGVSTNTITNDVVVTYAPPVAAFTGTPLNPYVSQSVTFTSTSTGTITNWLWNLGDGTTVTNTSNANVVHAYAAPGTYTVSLMVAGPGGANTNTRTAYVVVTYAPPVAAFSGTPTSLFLSQSVTFTSTSTGVITNWLWNLGDGTTVTNTSNANVVHAYALPGTYTVSLTVGGPGGANTNTQTAYIVVKAKISVSVATLVNGNLVISGVNGPVGGQYRILNTTDLTLPLANWTPVWTNTFAPPNGSFSYTNAPGTNAAGFFLMVSP